MTLCEEFLANFSPDENGSCMTGLAAINTNRQFIGCEIDSEYYNKSIKRLKKYLPEDSKISIK